MLNINVADFVKGARQVNATDVVEGLALDGIDASGLEKSIQQVLEDPNLKRSPAKLVAKLSNLISEQLGDDGLIDKKTLSDSLTETLTVMGTQVDFAGS